MNRTNIWKKPVSLMLLIMMIVSSTVINAFATDNPAGETIQINNGDIDLNEGTVEVNNGTVDKNAAPTEGNPDGGIIKENNGEVTENNGTVLENAAPTEGNPDGGTIKENNGEVIENNGTVLENTAPTNENPDGGIIEENNGEVTENNGTIQENAAPTEGNPDGGFVETNNIGGIIEVNNGTVELNAGSYTIGENWIQIGYEDTGLIEENNGTVGDNHGIIEINSKDGIIEDNYGRVGKTQDNQNVMSDIEGTGNFGIIETNHGLVTINSGTITYNGTVADVANSNEVVPIIEINTGSVVENNGIITHHNGNTVKTNNGEIWVLRNGAEVELNSEDGKIQGVEDATVIENKGQIYVVDKDGIIESNSGTIGGPYVSDYWPSESKEGDSSDWKLSYNPNIEHPGTGANHGQVKNNTGIVFENTTTGIVDNYENGVVILNNGDVYNYGGTITTNNGNEYFTIQVNGENGSVKMSDTFKTHNDQNNWLSNQATGTITLTADEGYEIESVDAPEGITTSKDDSGIWSIVIKNPVSHSILKFISKLLPLPTVTEDKSNEIQPTGEDETDTNLSTVETLTNDVDSQNDEQPNIQNDAQSNEQQENANTVNNGNKQINLKATKSNTQTAALIDLINTTAGTKDALSFLPDEVVALLPAGTSKVVETLTMTLNNFKKGISKAVLNLKLIKKFKVDEKAKVLIALPDDNGGYTYFYFEGIGQKNGKLNIEINESVAAQLAGKTFITMILE